MTSTAREKLGSLLLILWLALFGYAAVFPMIFGRQHRPFQILDAVAHGLIVFVAFVVAFAGWRRVTWFLFLVLNAYLVAFLVTLVSFDGKITAYDVFVGLLGLALCVGAILVFRRRGKAVYEAQAG